MPMDKDFIPDTRTEEEKNASIFYWLSKTVDELHAEMWRLSVERYGAPQANLRDGPLRKYRRNTDGTKTLIRACSHYWLDFC
ncbi:hypothetical protein [Granulicella mallensis]|uniref:Uncharacterized protein n=1 Tax=Granulicella mallensis TaxID=940614 RepID=A0A7W8ECF6_9BACT|nr:hypothetical protein [Granulicella mallensis]MBB5065555.1 hypothetical protein [Granulicella mallensis]